MECDVVNSIKSIKKLHYRFSSNRARDTINFKLKTEVKSERHKKFNNLAPFSPANFEAILNAKSCEFHESTGSLGPYVFQPWWQGYP